MCEYCERKTSKGNIAGKDFKVHKTIYLKEKTNTDNLNCFILKNENEKAGFMIGTCEGYHYIDINYCPMCGRDLRRRNNTDEH